MTTVPAGVRGAGKVTIWAVPTVADLEAITVAEINGATTIDLSCLLTDAPDLGMVHEKVDTNRLCLENAIQSFGRITYDPNGLLVAYDPQNPASDVSKAYTALTNGTNWVLVFRYGIDSGAAAAAGQYYDAVQISVGQATKVPPEEGAELVANIPITVSGNAVFDEQLVGSSPASP